MLDSLEIGPTSRIALIMTSLDTKHRYLSVTSKETRNQRTRLHQVEILQDVRVPLVLQTVVRFSRDQTHPRTRQWGRPNSASNGFPQGSHTNTLLPNQEPLAQSMTRPRHHYQTHTNLLKPWNQTIIV
jgi:hypothetical protein